MTVNDIIRPTRTLIWEGSTTVVYTVVWRNPVVWWEGGNTALWLVRKCFSLYVPSMNCQAMGSSSANHCAVFPSPFSANHGISPNDSVHDSGWPLPFLVVFHTGLSVTGIILVPVWELLVCIFMRVCTIPGRLCGHRPRHRHVLRVRHTLNTHPLTLNP